jgi:large subunit ribosomal protein L34e
VPRPSERTRSKKRVSKSLPGSGQSVHYRLRAGAAQRCLVCKRPLAGVPRLSRVMASKLSRGKKRILRPFGGQVCHDCLKRGLKQAARSV